MVVATISLNIWECHVNSLRKGWTRCNALAREAVVFVYDGTRPLRHRAVAHAVPRWHPAVFAAPRVEEAAGLAPRRREAVCYAGGLAASAGFPRRFDRGASVIACWSRCPAGAGEPPMLAAARRAAGRLVPALFTRPRLRLAHNLSNLRIQHYRPVVCFLQRYGLLPCVYRSMMSAMSSRTSSKNSCAGSGPESLHLAPGVCPLICAQLLRAAHPESG